MLNPEEERLPKNERRKAALWFTYTDVLERPHEVMEQVRRALGSGA